MDDLDNKVDIWEHQRLQEDVWELQRELEKLREEFRRFREIFTGDGK
jgi:hypothetical protein